MEYDQILELVKEVSKAGLSNFEYQEGDVRLSMSCPDTTENVVVKTMESSLKTDVSEKANDQEQEKGSVVVSPLVGTFYAAPSENEEPFVKVGDMVTKGQTLAIVEAMKLMNEIESDFDGIVTEICVDNAQSVEYGQPLFRIK
ncbi:MAG: acetyl-CoA carboxylase biotin carboxyl carrier protein [Lachnospiraceae bacterium]|nr:acetyl-CoA carboxylase biotin carboxyl carrier protein [Lachnospiraceae bacterium]